MTNTESPAIEAADGTADAILRVATQESAAAVVVGRGNRAREQPPAADRPTLMLCMDKEAASCCDAGVCTDRDPGFARTLAARRGVTLTLDRYRERGEAMAMTRIRSTEKLVAGLFLVLAVALGSVLVLDGRSTSSAATTPPRLVAVRAAHHPGFDRVVFEFSGSVPSRRNVRYVSRLVADPSGKPVRIAGRAILEASFSPATAHTAAGAFTAPGRIAYALPNVITVVRSGDFESVLSYGIGLAKRTSFHVFTLGHPSRVVIDIATPFRTVVNRVYFENLPNFSVGHHPYVTGVLRPVLATAPATAVMDRLFAGPTDGESRAGLGAVLSKATGFTGLSIQDQVARIRLTGGCSSGGSTFTIADEIYPTVKQFATVDFVKIYDPSGHTETPNGHRDSIPTCLEP